MLVAQGESVPCPILEIGNTNSRYRFDCGASEFVNRWNAAGEVITDDRHGTGDESRSGTAVRSDPSLPSSMVVTAEPVLQKWNAENGFPNNPGR